MVSEKIGGGEGAGFLTFWHNHILVDIKAICFWIVYEASCLFIFFVTACTNLNSWTGNSKNIPWVVFIGPIYTGMLMYWLSQIGSLYFIQ